jgi:hypothetical protein
MPRTSFPCLTNMKIQRIDPDLSSAFVALAPIVAEAAAFVESQQYALGLDALRKARAVIAQATTTCVCIDTTDPVRGVPPQTSGMDAEPWSDPQRRRPSTAASPEDASAKDHGIDRERDPIR